MMALKFSNSQEFLNKLQLFINMFIAFPMLAFIILFLRIENRTYNPDFLGDEWIYYLRFIVFVAVVVLVFMGVVNFNRKRDTIDASMSIREKLEIYYSASVSRSYYYLSATILALIGLTLTAEKFYVIYYTICLVAFSMTYPTIYRINRQLRLNREEREIIISRKGIK
jgi:hypothetical protein